MTGNNSLNTPTIIAWLLVGLCFITGAARALEADCVAGHAHSEAQLHTLAPSDLESLTELPSLPAGEIRIIQQDIFPQARRRIFKLANRWHRTTEPDVIVQALSFRSGEFVESRASQEAERLLRAKPYFFDARILPRKVCPDRVDLDVIVREVWTLTPTLSFSRSGGESDSEVGFTDTNWRGTGRTIGMLIEREPTHTGVELFIKDSPAPDTWVRQLTVSIADKQEQFRASLSKPFYALETDSARGISVASVEEDRSGYVLGDKVLSYESKRREAQVFGGIKLSPRQNTRVIRGLAGWRYLDEDLTPIVDTAGQATPIQRRFSYPFAALEWVDDNFVKATDLSRIGLVEDINLGWQGWLELGLSQTAWGASDDYLHTQTHVRRQWLLDDTDLITAQLSVSGRFNLDQSLIENLRTDLNLNYLHKWSARWRTFVGSAFSHGRNLDPENSLQLGGRTGLRAFPSNYQAGSKRYVLSLEQRLHTTLQPLDLFRLAYVAFADAGRAWYDDPPAPFVTAESDAMIANIGLGLRLESIRTGSKRVLHFDVATPLGNEAATSAYEISFSVKQTL